MIQRVQTVWLLLSLACCVLLFFIPVWESSSPAPLGMDEIGANSHLFLLPFAVLLVVSHLVTIFLFGKRKLQMKFCMANILLYLIFFVLALTFIQQENNVLSNFHLNEFKSGALLPLIGIILNVRARRGIRKDEELIRSMDRLR
jgi:hypothetical protein